MSMNTLAPMGDMLQDDHVVWKPSTACSKEGYKTSQLWSVLSEVNHGKNRAPNNWGRNLQCHAGIRTVHWHTVLTACSEKTVYEKSVFWVCFKRVCRLLWHALVQESRSRLLLVLFEEKWQQSCERGKRSSDGMATYYRNVGLGNANF